MKPVLTVFAALYALTSGTANFQFDWTKQPGNSPRRAASILYQYYVELKNKRDYTAAKAHLDRMILQEPNSFFNYLEKSKLCYETQDFAESATRYQQFKDRFPLKDQPVGLLASNFVMETLVMSAKAHRKPDWRLFSAKFGPEVILVETLSQACYSAIAENRTRTAAVILDEMQKLGVSADELNGIRGSLKKRIESGRSSDRR